jgi:hypothetical protein
MEISREYEWVSGRTDVTRCALQRIAPKQTIPVYASIWPANAQRIKKLKAVSKWRVILREALRPKDLR